MDLALYKAMFQVEERHWWFTARRHIVGRVICSLDLPSDAQILDMGCGTGGNLKLLSGFGDVTGIELEPEARELAHQRDIAPVLSGSLPYELPDELPPFDLVVLLDVLEHIDNHGAALAILREQLKPGGVILLTVPALPCLWGRHDEIHHHYRRYTRESIQQLAEQTELKVELLSYCNSWLLPVVAFGRWLERILPARRAHSAMGLSIPPAPINGLLHGIFASEAGRVQKGGFPLGVSLLAVLRKDD